MKNELETQKVFNQKVKQARQQVAELLAIYQNGTSGYEYEVEIESALKQAYFSLERI